MDGLREQTGERVRLAFGPFLWWTFAILALTGELALWLAIHRQARGFPPHLRLEWLIGYTPRTLFLAFVMASLLTVVVDLFVKAAVNAPLRRWLNPRTDREDDAGRGYGFHLDATERILEVIPGRQVVRRRAEPGTLVLTDRRVWFFPSAWDAEPWSLSRDQVHATRVVPPSGMLQRLLEGLPPHLLIDAGPESDTRARFALADPHRVRSWLHAEPSAFSRSI